MPQYTQQFRHSSNLRAKPQSFCPDITVMVHFVKSNYLPNVHLIYIKTLIRSCHFMCEEDQKANEVQWSLWTGQGKSIFWITPCLTGWNSTMQRVIYLYFLICIQTRSCLTIWFIWSQQHFLMISTQSLTGLKNCSNDLICGFSSCQWCKRGCSLVGVHPQAAKKTMFPATHGPCCTWYICLRKMCVHMNISLSQPYSSSMHRTLTLIYNHFCIFHFHFILAITNSPGVQGTCICGVGRTVDVVDFFLCTI